MQQDKLVYLTDPYKKEHETEITDVVDRGNGAASVTLKQTIFYVEGGGQSSDQGTIKGPNGTLQVKEIRLEEGDAVHKGQLEGELNIGDKVTCTIDWDRRYKNMKIHTIGHLVDYALADLGLSPQKLLPTRASHRKKAWVEYEIEEELTPEESSDLKSKIERHIQDYIEQNLKITWEFVSLEELKEKATWLPENLPQNKPLRSTQLENHGAMPDGGTLLREMSELKDTKIAMDPQIKGSTLVVNYTLEDSTKPTKKEKTKSQQIDLSEFPEIANILRDAKSDYSGITTDQDLESVRIKYLGKKGLAKSLLKKIGEQPPEKRKNFGMAVHKLTQNLEALQSFAETQEKQPNNQTEDKAQSKTARSAALPLDSIAPKKNVKLGRLHPLTEVTRQINEVFIRLGFSVLDGPEIETDEYNFGRTNLPKDHPARDLWDTLFIEYPEILMRTHTSSVEARAMEKYRWPLRIVTPGVTYRAEKPNPSNHFVFHQYQGVAIDQGITLKNLIGTFDHLFKAIYGDDVILRYRCKYYPEVEPGLGVDMQCTFCKGDGCRVCKDRGWIEMLGAGVIHPNMMKMAGIDPQKVSGYAFGMGLDRWAMTKYNIDDIRTLVGDDLRYRPL